MKTQQRTSKQTTLNITGMACSGCANTVQQVLIHMKGVTHATVDLENESASVIYDGDLISLDDFKQTIEHAGYALKGMAQ